MKLLIDNFDISHEKVQRIIEDSLINSDDGELYLERSEKEILIFDNQRLKVSSFDQDCGFGLRSVVEEATCYFHSDEFSLNSLYKAKNSVLSALKGYSGIYAVDAKKSSHILYEKVNPSDFSIFLEKITLLKRIDDYIRKKDQRVCQVTVSLKSLMQYIEILRPGGYFVKDVRPLVNLTISVVTNIGSRLENGFYGYGGRNNVQTFIKENKWRYAADQALRQALINLESEDAPAGTFDVVLGNGWPGIMLHEAVGHGLEGDFNRKNLSAFSNLIGEKVASKGVTVIDDGTIPEKRGSYTFDDEGTPSNKSLLIEDGILVGYMQDRLNARLMKTSLTGNGRRESYNFLPIPRMTNTMMMNGNKTPQEIISSVKKGVYCVSFGGGQVDITSGNFVFECKEAYIIDKGKIKNPIKGATLIGNGPVSMKHISMIGNDSILDNGIGTCGKEGQNIPVGVGQPHLRINRMTIGGTKS